MSTSTSDFTTSAAACPQSTDLLYRRALKATVSAVCVESGFTDAMNEALETLTEILQSFLTELTRSTKAFSEHSGRTDPLVTDVVMALVEMGQRVDQLPAYSRRVARISLPAPSQSAAPQEPRRLQVGSRKPHKSHIMDYMPPFPDPHTYIRSATYKAPSDEYEMIREKAACEKRDVERSLTRFIAKTGDTENLFSDDPYAFPLIANKPKPLPYMEALLPKEHEAGSTSQDDENQLASSRQTEVLPTTSKVPLDRLNSTTSSVTGGLTRTDSNMATSDVLDTESLIDNPYLRPIKMPKLKTTSKKTKY